MRLAYAGYLGHMFELYAMWAWIGAAAAASYHAFMPAPQAEQFAKLTAFCAIGAGGFASAIAGRWADRIGKAEIAILAMMVSGASALAAAATFGGPVWLTFVVVIVWGASIIPDSAQFSALVADASPPHQAGTLLTFQTALGFALTFVTVQLTPVLASIAGMADGAGRPGARPGVWYRCDGPLAHAAGKIMSGADDIRWRTGAAAINGFRQFWRAWQPREPATLPVLALHGSLTQSGMWKALAEAAGTIPMLCPDQRGFGLSDDPGDDSCAAFAADAVALAQHLLPARYVIMGHSFACSIALEAARLADETRGRGGAGRPGGAGWSAAGGRAERAKSRAAGRIRDARRGRAAFPRQRGRRMDRRNAAAFRRGHHAARRRSVALSLCASAAAAACAPSPPRRQATLTSSPRQRRCAARCWCFAAA